MVMMIQRMMMKTIVTALFSCWVGFADFMHDFNLETKHGFKIKTEAPEIKILSLQSNFKVLAYMRE